MNKPELIPVTIAGAFTFGMVLAVLGSLKLPLAKRLNITPTPPPGDTSAQQMEHSSQMLSSTSAAGSARQRPTDIERARRRTSRRSMPRARPCARRRRARLRRV